jgi:HAD superfamily hydrolase (TIGR01509 family)
MPCAFSSKRHFLFDLDGTLVNSIPAHERAFIETLKIHYPQVAENFDYTIFAGRPTREVFLALGFNDELEINELTEGKQRFYREAIERGDVTVFAGAKSLLAQLRKSERHLFLVTGASRISTHRVLELTALTDYFEGITAAEDTHPGKPSPEPYLYTLATYGLDPHDCLVIEDAESGIRSARGAGLDVVLIHTELQLPGAINVGNCENLAALLFS